MPVILNSATTSKTYKRPLKPTPTKLYENGKFNYASFDGTIQNPNFIDATKPYKLPLPHTLKWMLFLYSLVYRLQQTNGLR